ncbi:MAG: DUF882 domain-containing protein [Paracoccaceae bacterium]|jgi:uncharacterized protein YcbK (DUF882 family)
MLGISKVSRRSFLFGCFTTGVCQAATPLIDINRQVKPFVERKNKTQIIDFGTNNYFVEKNKFYFDPEPEVSRYISKENRSEKTTKYVPSKNFRIRLVNQNTSETTNFSVKSSFLYDYFDYEKLDYFLRDWREDEQVTMDRAAINNFLKICEGLLGSGNELEVIITSGYRTRKTNEKLRMNSSRVAKNSMHLLGRAIDFKITNRSMRDLEKVAVKLTPGGLGVYSGFIHIDTGPYRRWRA